MRSTHVNSFVFSGVGFVQYFLLFAKVVHGLIVALPGLIIVYISGGVSDFALSAIFVFSCVSVLVFQTFDVYSEAIFNNLFRFKNILVSWCAAFVFLFLLINIFDLNGSLNLFKLFFWFFFSLILFVLFRIASLGFFKWCMARKYFLRRAVIWGAEKDGSELAKYLKEHQDIRSGVIGFIDDRIGRLPSVVEGMPVIGNMDKLIEMIQQGQVEQVLVALPWHAAVRLEEVTSRLGMLPVSVLIAPDMQAFKLAHSRISEVGGIPMLNVSDFPLKGWSPLVKRIEDIVLSSFFIILSVPVFLIVPMLIKIESKGPVFFKQKRYGYSNNIIEVYKFRTMFHELRDANASQQTIKGDIRVTRIGRLLRRTSLDELPQLFNVFSGHMSMVGPRPHARLTKAEGVLFEEAVQNYSARHRVKPGITGWAQINGYRGETDTLYKIEKRVEYDLEYIEKWSVLFDIYIIIKTIPSVVFSKQAY